MAVNHIAEFQRARRDAALVVVPGFHALKHAIRFGADIVRAVASEEADVDRLTEDLAPDLGGQLRSLLERVPRDTFDKLSRNPPTTGVLALARRPEVDVTAVLGDLSPAPLVFLENPRGLGNIGAVIRVAAAAGAAGVLCRGQPDPWDPAAVRGAAGLHFALPVAKVERLPTADPVVGPPAVEAPAVEARAVDVPAVRSPEVEARAVDAPTADPGVEAIPGPPVRRPLVALDPKGEPLSSITVPRRALLAFGAERRGLSAEVLEQADLRVRIPMRAGVSSLNLATSVAAVLYSTFSPD